MDNNSIVQKHTFHNKIWAIFVLAATFIVYLLTVAPTVAFWDCGEYIGACYSLGVPHPPGNPLYVLIGRAFSIFLFFIKGAALRINLISVISGSFTAMFIYLIIVRSMVSFIGIPDNSWKRITTYLAGITGAFYCAFGYTFWFSSVEASVYIPSMCVISLCTWLTLVWYQSKSPDRDRLLVLITYIAFLGIGIHMMSMMALIPAFLFVVLTDRQKMVDWRLWVVAVALSSVIYNVSAFIWMGPVVLVSTYAASFMESQSTKKWRFYFWIALFAVLGYSVHIYVPIRSALRPIIDENHPVVKIEKSGKINWKPFKNFLDRKQYGSESMVTRMFWRRGSWDKQLGIDSHMGYGGFHLTQFFHFGKSVYTDRNQSLFKTWGSFRGFLFLLIYIIPTLLVLYGWYYLYKKNSNLAIFLIAIFLVTSIGLVIYMNFADGNHAEKRDYMAWVNHGHQGQMPTVHREVRIRDYFFSSGFMFLSMWVGIAAGCLMHSFFSSKNRFLRKQVAPILVVLFAVSPALPLTQNYGESDRSGDWIPYDYAYNLLMSCEKDGILFTNGDNDTFPLWFLQEAAGIRKDVRVVNLSLLNTKWYIKQLKDLEPKVPISFSHSKIDALTHELNPFEKKQRYSMSNAEIRVVIPSREEKRALRVQDKMILNIVDSNKWKKPVYLAVTVSRGNMMGLEPYLQMQGLVYRVQPNRIREDKKLDLKRTTFLLEKVYSFRGLGNGKVLMNETSTKLLSNYAASFIQAALNMYKPLENMKNDLNDLNDSLARLDSSNVEEISKLDSLIKAKKQNYNSDLDIAINLLDQCVGLMPWDSRPRRLRQELLTKHGRYEQALENLKHAKEMAPDNPEYLKREAQLLQLTGDVDRSMESLKKLVETDEDPWFSYSLLAKNYTEKGMKDSALKIMNEYLQMHPGDRRAKSMISQLEQPDEKQGQLEINNVINQ